MNNSIRSSAARNERRRAWFRAALAAMMLTPLVGCASKPRSDWSSNSYSKQVKRKGARTVAVNHTKTYSQTASRQRYFTEKAKKNNLPEKYLSEARIGMTEVDKRLAKARADEITRDAVVRKETARISNKRVDAEAKEETELAELDELKKTQAAQQSTLVAQLAARERQAKAAADKNAGMAEALAKEKRTVQQDLISRAEKGVAEAKAHIEELRVIRVVTEKEGAAALQMARENAQATRTRAVATATALRQEAQSVMDKTTARVAELVTKIATMPTQFQAKGHQIMVKASSVEDQGLARAAELEARAAAKETQSAEHKYNLMVSLAKTERETAQTAAEHQGVLARTAHDRDAIEVEQLRGDAHMMIQAAQAEATRQFGGLNAWFKRSKADIDRLRAAADRLEKSGRAEFVKAIARHTADAVRETNEHQKILSEAQMKTTIAGAESKAALLHEHLYEELVRQTKAGKVELSGKTAATNESMELDVPTSAKVTAVSKSIDADTISVFRSNLAQVLHDRVAADAQFSSLEASFNQQKVNSESVRVQRTALANENLATADAILLKSVADLGETNANITASLATARSDHDRAMVEAETFRKAALADAAEMRAQAKAIADDAAARAVMLRRESQAITESGQSEVDATKVALRSTEEQGEAEASRLLAEAGSVEASEAALAEQIDAEISTVNDVLVAELANLDRQIESSTAIAKTDYNEMLAEANAVGLKAEMEIKRLAARNELEKAIAQSEIERLHDLHFVNSMKSDAVLERRLATVQADRADTAASLDAEQVAIAAYSDITAAAVESGRRIAAARAQMVQSLFNTRLVEVDADKVKARAEALLRGSNERANAETILAKAKAASEKTKDRIARLVRHQKSLQRVAVEDWDARLHKNPKEGFQP